MAGRKLLLSAVASLVLAGCLAPSPADVAEPAAAESAAPAPMVGALSWTGHVLHSATDPLLHTAPTEGVLWPFEQAGIIVEIPEGVSAVEVAVAWEGDGTFGIHLHSHNADHEYVGHRSTREQWNDNPHCIRVPAGDVAPGRWMVMIHSRNAVDVDFTITVLAEGVEPVLVDERHGHDRVKESLDGERLEEHEPEACTMWTPEAADHAHAERERS